MQTNMRYRKNTRYYKLQQKIPMYMRLSKVSVSSLFIVKEGEPQIMVLLNSIRNDNTEHLYSLHNRIEIRMRILSHI